MRLVVITPVGPGHERFVAGAVESVLSARDTGTGQFTSVRHVVVHDTNGSLGRGRARNLGMLEDDAADFYFFLDADDRMRIDALEMCDCDAQATFGEVSLNNGRRTIDIHPCGWREIALHGARGTLCMGFFCRADVARRLRFNEDLIIGEDFEFYLRLDNFVKRDRPLVDIGYDRPSAGGPRGYGAGVDWTGICNGIIAAAVVRDPTKYDLGRDAVLAKA